MDGNLLRGRGLRDHSSNQVEIPSNLGMRRASLKLVASFSWTLGLVLAKLKVIYDVPQLNFGELLNL